MAEEKGEKVEEKESPAEEYSETESSGDVKIPEEFQRQVTALISECDNKECLAFIRECVYQKEEEMRKAEYAKEKKGKSKTPSEYSTADMPA